MKLLRAADRPALAWKNGGGVTREVAVCPGDAGMADFDWRVSIAEVTAPGPFSRFDGIDRVLIVLDGRLSLRIVATGEVVVLDPGRPFAFAGDVGVYGTPVDGPVRDLNVMVRRDRWRASVAPVDPMLPTGGIRIAVATTAGAGVAALDALVPDGDERLPVGFAGHQVRFDAIP